MSEADDAPGFARSLRAFRSKNFAILWLGNLLSNTGSWMQSVAEPWLVLRLSGSPTLLGVDSFAMDAPVLLLTLLGGWIADRHDRRRTALLFQGAQLACPVVLIALLSTNRVRVWEIVVLSFIVGATDAISMPSIASLIPSSVPKRDIAGAIALNSAQFNASRVLGPFLAGLVLSGLGVTACFVFNAATYVPFLLAISLVRLPRAAVPIHETGAPDTSLLAAVRVVVRDRSLRRALAKVVTSSLFCAPLVTFIPVIVRDVFHLGSAAFGTALSVFGIGGLIGAASVLPLTDNPRRHKMASIAALCLSVATMAVALNRSYLALLALLFVAGAAMVATNTAASSVLQSSIDDRLRGRVASIYALALRGGAPIGNLATGLVVSRWGVHVALLVNGALALLVHATLVSSRPRSPVST